jgi:hypothetical protein
MTMTVRVMPVLAVAMALASCGDAPTCEVTIRAVVKNVDDFGATPGEREIANMVALCSREKWSPDRRRCLGKAKTAAHLTGCVSAPADKDGEGGVRRSEAELNLSVIRRLANFYFVVHGHYPVTTTGLTPAEPCCRSGGVTKCPGEPESWRAWDVLGFQITESHYFRYSYESDGTTYEAQAVGDLDCDTVTAAFELRGTSAGGLPEARLIRPTRVD